MCRQLLVLILGTEFLACTVAVMNHNYRLGRLNSSTPCKACMWCNSPEPRVVNNLIDRNNVTSTCDFAKNSGKLYRCSQLRALQVSCCADLQYLMSATLWTAESQGHCGHLRRLLYLPCSSCIEVASESVATSWSRACPLCHRFMTHLRRRRTHWESFNCWSTSIR